MMKKLGKYSFGIGDRFGLQGTAQLKALQKAKEKGVNITPVWNKSNREHRIIYSVPADTRHAADAAVKKSGWKDDYFVDADHINRSNVEGFIEACDFFTIDIADFIGKPSSNSEINEFVNANAAYIETISVPGIFQKIPTGKEFLVSMAHRFLAAMKEAQAIYQYIASRKGEGQFITEISMDEVTESQSPAELFLILSGLAKYGIPVQTIAPKFPGNFYKGVEYQGDLEEFRQSFEQYILITELAKNEFGLPESLKLSLHSGSDKFSVYPIIGELLRKYDKGIHVKTAGTSWLEEIAGLALSGGEAFELAKMIYKKAYERRKELCLPYASVISIEDNNLPQPKDVNHWSPEQFAGTLQHKPENSLYNPSFRQLMHVAYKIAAEYSNIYVNLVMQNHEQIAGHVTENLYERHIRRIFEIR